MPVWRIAGSGWSASNGATKGTSSVSSSTRMVWTIVTLGRSVFMSPDRLMTKLRWPGVAASSDDILSIPNTARSNHAPPTRMTVTDRQSIKRLPGHCAAVATAAGVTDVPMLIPITRKIASRSRSGITARSPRSAVRVTQKAGPVRNGAGTCRR